MHGLVARVAWCRQDRGRRSDVDLRMENATGRVGTSSSGKGFTEAGSRTQSDWADR